MIGVGLNEHCASGVNKRFSRCGMIMLNAVLWRKNTEMEEVIGYDEA